MVSYINSEVEFQNKKRVFEALFKTNNTFPDRVFNDDFIYFMAFDFYHVFSDMFIKGLINYINIIGEKDCTMYSKSPSPEYFLETIKYYGIGVITSDSTIKEFIQWGSYDPEKTLEDFFMITDEVLVFSSNSDWAIFSSRSWDVGLVGFKTEKQQKFFLEAYGEDHDIFYPLAERIQDLDDMFNFSDETKAEYQELLENNS